MRILETLSWAEIGRALGAVPWGPAARRARGASIDTRTLEPGDIFFALKGEHSDGHAHLRSAFEKGAACAVIQDAARADEVPFALIVEDTETALFELGRLIRREDLHSIRRHHRLGGKDHREGLHRLESCWRTGTGPRHAGQSQQSPRACR